MQMVTHSSVVSCPRVTPKGDAIIVEKISMQKWQPGLLQFMLKKNILWMKKYLGKAQM